MACLALQSGCERIPRAAYEAAHPKTREISPREGGWGWQGGLSPPGRAGPGRPRTAARRRPAQAQEQPPLPPG